MEELIPGDYSYGGSERRSCDLCGFLRLSGFCFAMVLDDLQCPAIDSEGALKLV
jgi:hypothetical protein